VPADHLSRPPRKRRRRSRSSGESAIIDTGTVSYAAPPDRHAWALVRSDWLGDPSPWESRVEERRVARGQLTKALTSLTDAEVVRLLRGDRELSLIATHFGRPFVVPGALESFLHEVHRARHEQAANVARLDAYDAALVGAPPDAPPAKPATVRRSPDARARHQRLPEG
jgi:hypothetical protein